MGGLIQDLQQYYSDYVAADPAQLEHLYREDVIFCDPLHRIEGLPALKRYFAAMSEGLSECRFEFEEPSVADGSACLPWHMHYAHRSLNGGRPLVLRGCSLIRYAEKVYYHEDFYDLGAMVYERVPLLGALVRGVKSRLQASGS
ncbi:nuclear transport factor 2 family protein [Microbulbifer marinus]|uniref:SnoaL-like domain-containing protein n=1 Tax=Microbulbifer marinus TaxID=658218 RepID=A0A1H3WCC5_9GAMM|nr:nuclear transport factor 2 family protein [Microbulbifer marinus]SDZ84786.1 SnoaL-like domain-containing protein [Microbulbifer marinus]